MWRRVVGREVDTHVYILASDFAGCGYESCADGWIGTTASNAGRPRIIETPCGAVAALAFRLVQPRLDGLLILVGFGTAMERV